MTWKVLIAHAEDEEHLAEQLAGPIRDAGYEVAHRGTVLVGDSILEEASKVLLSGGPVVLCGTVRAMGTGWAYRLVNAARQNYQQVVIFPVQMEQDAYLQPLALDGAIARYWQDPTKAIHDLIASLKTYYPLDAISSHPNLPQEQHHQEQALARYRALALESCDIVDLANMPETDRHVATRRLELRRLYVALRVWVEVTADNKPNKSALDEIEQRRGAMLRGAAAWGGAQEGERVDPRERVPVGQRLAEARRLVVLGDPGAGKSTLLRWIATAYLLRLKRDPDWQALPDVATLPDTDWLPIIIRCRDLDQSSLGGALDDILRHTLRKTELSEDESAALQAVLREKLLAGEALLLLDGLDEIAEPALRARFCRQIERIHAAYPNAPIIATSRIVGYREMGYRIGRGFEHVTVAELSKDDKDDFARRWCALVEPPERRMTAEAELKRDIHSADRIERLTGNPMLLTTMALVKRKVGKLPSRRADLYWEAVQVLLNWRSEVDEPIDQHEAVPQLEYLAYAMCDRGAQRLREDEIIALLKRMRQEYPQIHAARGHTPEAFLRLLERRTGILIEAGRVRHRGRPVAVFEFRHLTFQEYLAGLALVDGRFPDRDRERSLAENVAPLAGRTSEVQNPRFDIKEVAVTENWREALRLCVASCGDDDVNDVLLTILKPLEGEDAKVTARPRAVLAALCLADEPNASEDTARKVLGGFVEQTGENDGKGSIRTSVDVAALELATSRWTQLLRSLLVEEFCRRDAATRGNVGGLCGMVCETAAPSDETAFQEWFNKQLSGIAADDEPAMTEVALGIMQLAYKGRVNIGAESIDRLLAMLTGSTAAALASAWALAWLSENSLFDSDWQLSRRHLDLIISIIDNPASDAEAARWLLEVLSNLRKVQSIEPLLASLEHKNNRLRQAAAQALGQISDPRAVEPLLARLDDQDNNVRYAAMQALGQLGDSRAAEPLLMHLDDQDNNMRYAAVQALGQLDDPRAIEPLLARLDDQDRGMRYVVVQALGRLGDPRAVEPLLARLDYQDSNVRQATARALGQLGDPRAVEPLLARLDNQELRYEAAEALGQIGDPRGIEVLNARLSMDDADTRMAALGGLARTWEDETDRQLLSRDLDAIQPYLDPQAVIDEARIREAAARLQIPAEEVRSRYETLAQRFGLRLAWEPGAEAPRAEAPRAEAPRAEARS